MVAVGDHVISGELAETDHIPVETVKSIDRLQAADDVIEPLAVATPKYFCPGALDQDSGVPWWNRSRQPSLVLTQIEVRSAWRSTPSVVSWLT